MAPLLSQNHDYDILLVMKTCPLSADLLSLKMKWVFASSPPDP